MHSHVGATTADFVGVRLQQVDLAGAAAQVMSLCQSGRGGIVTTFNVDHAVQFRTSPDLARAYRESALSYADGMPIVWLSRLLGKGLPGRVAGSDLVPLVLESASRLGCSVHLIGGSPAVAAGAERHVVETYPDLKWTGHVSPPLGFDKDADLDRQIADDIAAVRPDIVLVCLGAPKQEAWALRHAERLPGSVLLCVGATVDFLAGTTPRAPRWMRKAGLEWLYRLLLEPKRLWRRYLVQDVRFLGILVRAVSDRYLARSRRP